MTDSADEFLDQAMPKTPTADEFLDAAKPQDNSPGWDDVAGFVPHQLGLLANAGVKGATGLATLAANTPIAAANAVTWADRKLGGNAPSVPYVNPFGEGADIIFGPNGQPQNAAERLEQSVAIPVAGVASGGASGIKALGQNMPMQYSGAVGGGLAGGVAKESGAGPLTQLAASVAGTIAGGGAAALGQKLGDNFLFKPAEEVAISRMARDFARDNNITPQQAQSILENSPEGTTLADVGGPNVQSLGRSVVNTPGEGRNNAINLLVGRQAGAAENVQNIVKSGFGSNDEFNATLGTLQDAQKQTAAPLYEKAFQAAPVTSERIQTMLQSPELQTGIKRGLMIQRIESTAEGVPFNPSDYAITGFNEAGDPIIGAVPNMRLLDAGKKGLDAMIGDQTDAITGKVTELGRALIKLKSSYVKQLDGINPDYAAARAAWSGPAQSQSALQMGRNFLNEDAETTAQDVSSLTPGDKKFFQIGAARAIADKAAANPNATVKNILSNDLWRQKLQAAMPSKNAYFDFVKKIQDQANQIATKNAILGNSTTAGQLMKEAEDMPAPLGGLNIGNVVDVAQRNMKGALIQFAKNSYNRLTTPPNVSKQLGNMLFNTDPAQNQATIQSWQAFINGKAPTPFINRAIPFAAPLLYQENGQ